VRPCTLPSGEPLLRRRARVAFGTATQCTRINDSRSRTYLPSGEPWRLPGVGVGVVGVGVVGVSAASLRVAPFIYLLVGPSDVVASLTSFL
jgi:hypothetical protein